MLLKDIPSKEFYSFFSLSLTGPLLSLFYKHYCGLKKKKKKNWKYCQWDKLGASKNFKGYINRNSSGKMFSPSAQ